MNNNESYTGLEIAIIGMACRLPGASNWRQYWHNLINDVDSVQRMPAQQDWINAKGVLKEKEAFDSAFFNYRPEEAELMNPVHRLFHECVWEALEDAGYIPDQYKGLIGLYAGAGEDMNWKLYSMLKNRGQHIDNFTLGYINNKDYLASLLSYKFNFKGPAFSINTACSTSLVAINLACRSLLMGEVKMALAGGVSISTKKNKGYACQEGTIYSSDGYCRAFDQLASGTVEGEGAGVVVLKRLTDAINDRDHIYAIIKGSAINNDGNGKVGFTAPGVEGQVACIRKAQKFAKVEPHTISYVETHGTGTRLGDPVEIEALNIAFDSDKKRSCAIGSVKTNIGHLDTAAGVTALIKVALSLKNKQIPSSLHFNTPNPLIDFDGGPFYVNTELKQWTRTNNIPLRAGVSSFGIGGTNAHTIIEEAPDQHHSDAGRPYKLLTISARTPAGIERYVHKLKDFLAAQENIDCADMSYTFQIGRKPFEYRRAVAYRDREDLIHILNGGAPQEHVVKTDNKNSSPVFLFPGQGSQYINMGKGLYEHEPVFRAEMDNGFSIFRKLTGASLQEVLFPAVKGPVKIHETRFTQPILFLLEYALARFMIHLGVVPRYMIGHSIGEYVAACISGLFSFEDTLKLVIKRGELMYNLPTGIMLSAILTEQEARSYLNEGVFLAAVNGPQQVVFSGEISAIDKLLIKFDELNIPYQKLHTSHAFHSGMLDPIMEDYRKELQKVKFGEITIPFISNLTGNFIEEAEAATPEYWVRHMRESVKFKDGVNTLLAENKDCIFIEVGPGHTLINLVKQQIPGDQKIKSVDLMATAQKTADDEMYLTTRIGLLWTLGVNIHWDAYYKNEKRRRVSLPTYPFEPVKYPVEVDPLENALAAQEVSIYRPANTELKDWIFYPIWKSAVLPEPEVLQEKGCLFFSTGDVFCESLRNELVSRDVELVEVLLSEKFEKRSGAQYCINATNPDHFDRLIKELINDRVLITDIIYGWCTRADAKEFELNTTSKAMNLVYFSIVFIVQAFLKNKTLPGKRITVLTNNLHKVTGNEPVVYIQSLALGLVNAIHQEHGIECYNVDLDIAAEPLGLAKVTAGEILANRNKLERVVAIRHNRRWVQDFQKNVRSLQDNPGLIKKRGVYFITGGLGNVGFTLAKYLIEHYQACIVLTGRKNLADAEKDEKWISRLHALKELNGSVRYYAVNVADLAAMREVVEDVETGIGKISGVIHAAGNLNRTDFELVEDITPQKALALFMPKVTGLYNLTEIFRHKKTDFVWITSSISSILGGLTFGSYAAANLFMDHFISSQSDHLLNWKCIDLSEMSFSEQSDETGNKSTSKALKSADLVRLFEWSIAVRDIPLMIQTIEPLPSRIQRAYTIHTQIHVDEDTVFVERSERPDLSSTYLAPQTNSEFKLVELIEKFFGIKNVGIQDSFFELGGDSLKAMVLLKRIKKEFSINMSLVEFFKLPNIQQMGAEIDEKMWINKNTSKQYNSII